MCRLFSVICNNIPNASTEHFIFAWCHDLRAADRVELSVEQNADDAERQEWEYKRNTKT